jgi:hypothetical protein
MVTERCITTFTIVKNMLHFLDSFSVARSGTFTARMITSGRRTWITLLPIPIIGSFATESPFCQPLFR